MFCCYTISFDVTLTWSDFMILQQLCHHTYALIALGQFKVKYLRQSGSSFLLLSDKTSSLNDNTKGIASWRERWSNKRLIKYKNVFVKNGTKKWGNGKILRWFPAKWIIRMNTQKKQELNHFFERIIFSLSKLIGYHVIGNWLFLAVLILLYSSDKHDTLSWQMNWLHNELFECDAHEVLTVFKTFLADNISEARNLQMCGTLDV